MTINCNIDDNLLNELNQKISKQNITLDQAITKGIELFLKNAVPRIPKTGTPDDYYCKAIRKIPDWAKRKEQINHKIIKAYFLSEFYSDGFATINNMKGLCSDPDHPELYIPEASFMSNYRQMKIDGEKSHGKVFIDDGTNVIIWDEVKEILMQYKEDFMN